MMTLLPLLSLATAVLAAPQAFGRQDYYSREADDGSDNGADYGSNDGSDDGSDDGSNYGSDFGSNMRMADDGSDMSMDDHGSEYGSEAEDFDNLTMSRAAEERAINTCNCAPVSSSDRIVGGKEVNPKYKLPYQVLVSPCNKQGHCF